MNWSKQVIDMLREGKTPSEIVAHFQHPTMTEKYIENLIKTRQRFLRLDKVRPADATYIHASLPKEGTKMREAWDRIHAVYRDNLALRDVLETRSWKEVSQELGIPWRDFCNYVQRRVYGYTEHSSTRERLRLDFHRQQRATKTSSTKQKIKRIQNLW